MKTLFAALVAVLALGVGSPASADDDGRTPRPEVVAPLSVPVVQIEGPANAWGVRVFAREAAREIPGLTIRTRGTCEEHPRAVCVRVFVGEWSDDEMGYIDGSNDPEGGWYGLTRYDGPRLRTLWLNARTRTENRYPVAVHEFGHVLGLDHHNALGIDGRTPDVVHLSKPELRALRSAYPAR